MFYQQQPKWDVYFRITTLDHRRVRTHLHSFLELLCCTDGSVELVIDGQESVLHAGEAALIFPYQTHSFTSGDCKGYFYTFDPELIGVFVHRYANMTPRDNRFAFCYDLESISESSDEYKIKAFLYEMCSYASRLEYEHTPVEGRALLEKIFILTEEKYKNTGFSLGKLAELLGYDYGYISKFFLRKTGIRYSDYLNQRRVACATAILRNGDADSIGDVAFACGYGSIRSFNRNFKELEGITPQAYRENMTK